jgi:hypothetical protein
MRFVPCVAGHVALAAAQQDNKFAVSNVEYQELPTVEDVDPVAVEPAN